MTSCFLNPEIEHGVKFKLIEPFKRKSILIVGSDLLVQQGIRITKCCLSNVADATINLVIKPIQLCDRIVSLGS
jgi:hypothetical protein